MYERIIYQSTACQEFGSLALFKLLTEAQIRNAQLEITGHLLFLDGQFTQCFEGPCDCVELLWKSIQRDKRHTNIELLLRHTAEVRRFPEWTMAFSTYSSLYVHGMQGFFPADDGELSPLISHCSAN